ncbi:MAG: hypothetical protein H7X94_14865 [Vallitaleaceae bacterium]|nr:hypothetical protein [Vallitaleaceae bacterium]
MLYPKNNQEFSHQLFENPTSEYRGTPFWAWNCEINRDILMEQIEGLKAMGFGGFHIHCRTGMATPYLGEEFMELVGACIEKAKTEEMKAWLYDEDRWPSGAAGGIVTKDPKFRAKYLLVTPVSYEVNKEKGLTLSSSAAAVRTGNGRLLARYDINLNSDGTLLSYHKMEEGDEATGTIWYAYLETPEPSPWFNNQTYLNTLDKDAVKEFVKVTHEAYKKAVGKDFGGVIPAIFTDEPQFSHKTTLNFDRDLKDVSLPWTDDLNESYKMRYGAEILDYLPELLWEVQEGVSVQRYQYHDHIAECFASAFADTIGDWCKKNAIMLTGHMMEEPTLRSQTAALGEAMRSYRGFELPGIDILCDYREYTTAKQAQSASHQYGRTGVLSELYGVTNWDFDFRNHKLQGDWQAALGVTVRVPHLSWVSMGGEAKRDYPASISSQVPWQLEYPLIEDHFARLNTALTRGKALVRIGVIHPIESYWLYFGTQEQTAAKREQMDKNFLDLTEWLLFSQMDFDFISESLFPELCEEGTAPLKVGEMQYDAIVVPGCVTLRRTTYERLKAFSKAGGKLIFMGTPPKYMDAVENSCVADLYNEALAIPYEKYALIQSLEAERELDIRENNGKRAEGLLYQMRMDGDCRWLFICHGKKPINPDVLHPEPIRIRLKGHWVVEHYDTINGEVNPIGTSYEGDATYIHQTIYAHDSRLFKLTPGKKIIEQPVLVPQTSEIVQFKTKIAVQLSEPNVLLLDMAEYAFDGVAFESVDEILRIDNKFREVLGYPSRMEAVAQPWVIKPERPEHQLTLRFTIESEIDIESPVLAVEDAATLKIELNGEKVAAVVTGYYVDHAIQTISLPKLKKGINFLELTIPFGRRTHTEWCYLLGDFGVRVGGCQKTLIAPVKELGFGDLTTQGLPFYGGNVCYKLPVESKGGQMTIRVPHYRGALIGVTLDGERMGTIAFAPYGLTIENVPAGKHEIGCILFGNRVNTFGTVHNANDSLEWFGPNAWRHTGDEWCDEYRLKITGILKSPEIIG